MHYIEFGENLAREAGAIMMQYFGQTKNHTTWKKDNSPLTIADTMINDMVIERINVSYPNHGILGEESSDMIGSEKYLWICDPIDGTIPYMLGLPMSTFLLALVDTTDGQPVFGVAYNPFTDEMYTAQKGEGMYRNGERLHVSDATSLEDSIVSFDGSKLYNGFRFAESMREKKAKVQKFNSFGFASLPILDGRIHASVYFNEKVHDVATLKILAEEAGGKVTDLDGNPQRYDRKVNGIVLTNGHVHEEVVEIIRKII